MPRIGGLGVFAGLLAAALFFTPQSEAQASTVMLLLLCAAPTFGAGLLEDLTKTVSVRRRLVASFASPLLAASLLGTQLTRLDTPGLDFLMGFAPLALLFTVFAVGGMTNAVNIIDGLNGLASGSVVLMLAGMGSIAWLHNDMLVLQLCGAGIAAAAGFMVLNYPLGRIFLGDGGAYLLGFWLAECAVLLLARNPEVSTWAALLVGFYPVWETVFSMYRRSFIRRRATGRPDMIHFHHLVFRRLVGTRLGHARPLWLRHGVASAIVWTLVIGCQAWAVMFSGNTALLALAAVIFALAYLWAYSSIVQACSSRPPALPHGGIETPPMKVRS